MNKKFIAGILSLTMMAALVGCGGSKSNETDSKEVEKVETTEEKKEEKKEDTSTSEKVGETVLKLSFNQSIENPEA